jgi:hypothetical protein
MQLTHSTRTWTSKHVNDTTVKYDGTGKDWIIPSKRFDSHGIAWWWLAVAITWHTNPTLLSFIPDPLPFAVWSAPPAFDVAKHSRVVQFVESGSPSELGMS